MVIAEYTSLAITRDLGMRPLTERILARREMWLEPLTSHAHVGSLAIPFVLKFYTVQEIVRIKPSTMIFGVEVSGVLS